MVEQKRYGGKQIQQDDLQGISGSEADNLVNALLDELVVLLTEPICSNDVRFMINNRTHYTFVVAFFHFLGGNFPMGHFSAHKRHQKRMYLLVVEENLLGQVLVVAGGGEGSGDTKDDDLLALQGADVQVLGDSAGVLQRGIVGAIFGE